MKQSGFKLVALPNCFLFSQKLPKENVVHFLQTYCSFSEGIHFLFWVAWFLLSIFQFQTLLQHKTQMVLFLMMATMVIKLDLTSVSDSTNEVGRFFGGGLGAFCFTGCSLNIEKKNPVLTFFFPLPKLVVRSSSWNGTRTHICFYLGFTSNESAHPFLRTCFNTLSHFFLISSVLGIVNKDILVFSLFLS